MAHLPGVNPLEPLVANYRKFFGEHADIIFDVGTRDGDDLYYLGEKLNQYGANLYAIDANPEMARQTKKDYSQFIVIHTAISNYNGTTTFQKVDHERMDYVGCSSIYADKLVNQEDLKGAVEVIEVPVTTMLDLFVSLDIYSEKIDLIKVDIEGYTYEFLEGLGSKITDVKCLHLETEQSSTHPNHRNSQEVREYMENAGFYLADKSYEWGYHIEDQVWVNKKLAINNTECWI